MQNPVCWNLDGWPNYGVDFVSCNSSIQVDLLWFGFPEKHNTQFIKPDLKNGNMKKIKR